jgi:oligopeptide transport system substrate-binding protein
MQRADNRVLLMEGKSMAISDFRYLLLLLAGIGLAACSGGGYEADVLRAGNGAEVQDLDPQLVTGVPEQRVLSGLFEGLTDLDPAGLAPIPGVAERWEAHEDGLGYTFHLRKNAKWSNGDPVTAQDFVYSWRRMLSPALAAEYAYLLHCIRNARAFNEGEITDFAEVGVKAADDWTLEVRLEHPTPWFPGMQVHHAWFPVHKATIEKFGRMDERSTRWTRAGHHVGNGPFHLAEWAPNEVIRVRANPHYWDAAHVRLKGIDYYPIDNQQTEERSFRSGELHLTSTVPLHKIAAYQRSHPDLIHLDPYLGVYYYRVNVTKPPFDDKRVRQAFSMALNRAELTDHVLKAGEKPAFTYVPQHIAGYTSSARVAFDVKNARALLAEAGYPDGKGLPPVEILYNTSEAHKTVAEAIQRMWKQNLNADVRLMNQDWKVYLASMNNLNYSVARSGWIGDVNDAINFLECYLTDNGNNRTGFSSEEYDTLIRRSYAETDNTKRIELLQQAEAILLDEMPVIPIYMYTEKYLMAKELKGLTPNILGYRRWQEMYLETPES